jgi:hypothetical protein
MSECMNTIGCVMAMASEQDSGQITSTSEGDPVLIFCFLSESKDQTLIPTSQSREFLHMGYLPVAIAQIDPSDPSEFVLRGLTGLSAALRFALEHKACDLVRKALDGLLNDQN